MISDWKEVSLKEICKTQYGYTASATDVNTGVKFLRITDIVPGFIDWNNVPYCQISEKDYLKYKVNENDIVVARTGATVGYAKQIRKGSPNSVFASYLVKLIPSDKADEKFLGILVESNIYKEFIQTIAGGSAQPNANANDLTLFKFKIPPLPVQQRIASILSAYDDLIEVNNQRIKLLEETARELYKEWFVRMRFPGYKQVKFKKGVPEGWEEKKIGDIILIKNGKQAVLQENGFFKVFGSNGEIGFSDNYNYEHVLVIGRVGAYCGSIEIAKEKIWATDNTLVALPKFETVGYYYSYYYLETLDLGNFATGSAQPLLTQSIIKRLELKIPPRDLVNSFESIVETMFDQIEILQQQNTQLRQIRDRLLPRLVSGKLKVSGSEFSELKNEQNQFKKNEQN